MTTEQKKEILEALNGAEKILDTWLPFKIKANNMASISVSLTFEDKIVFQKSYGFSDINSKKQSSPNTIYRIASISKIFTTSAILDLEKRKLLNLDDPVEKYLKWFKLKNSKGSSREITIRNLLSHTSGIARDGDTFHWDDYKFPSSERLRELMSNDFIIYKNNSKFKYSNYGFCLLGEIISEVTGINFEKYIESNILRPYNLNNTYVDYKKGIQDIATGYKRKRKNGRQKFNNIKANAFAPATGFMSNHKDLANIAIALLNNSSGILSKKTLNKMAQNAHTSDQHKAKYGLGLKVYENSEREIAGHIGAFIGYMSSIALDKKNKIGLIITSNTIDSQIDDLTKGILETIYYLLDHKKQFKLSRFKDNNKYTGIYESEWGDYCVVSIKGNFIVFEANTLHPVANHKVFSQTDNNLYLIKDECGFAYDGELARFEKNNKTTRMICGPRLSYKVNF